MSEMHPVEPANPEPQRPSVDQSGQAWAEPSQSWSPAGPGPTPDGQSWGAVGVPAYSQQVMMTDQRQVDSAVLVIAWVVAVLTAFYMLPWAIAVSRGKANHGAIGLLNFLLGWTIIGWVVALVMACQSHQALGPGATVVMPQQGTQAQFYAPVQQPQVPLPPAGWYPAPSGTGQQYWDGAAWTEHRAP